MSSEAQSERLRTFIHLTREALEGYSVQVESGSGRSSVWFRCLKRRRVRGKGEQVHRHVKTLAQRSSL